MNKTSLELKPREKIIKFGPESLLDYELLALMLSTGTKNESVLDLAYRLVNEYGLNRLFKLNYNELKSISGIKEAKASKLMATFELARRASTLNQNQIIDNAKDLYLYIKGEYLNLDYEVLTVIYVNAKCKIIAKRKYDSFQVNLINVPFKKIVGDAINLSSYGLFLIHNHPSGDVNPSLQDIDVTNELKKILLPLNIHLLDSIIIGNNKYFSLGEMIERIKNIEE